MKCNGILNGLAGVMWLAGLAFSHHVMANELYYAKSLYRNIVVYEDEGLRCMKFGRMVMGRQSCIQLSDHGHLVFNYTKMMMGALYLNPHPKRVLIVGLGGGTLPSALHKLLPGTQIDVVEIDAAVADVAQRFFYFSPSEQVRVTEEDGRVFVKRALKKKEKYDLVMLDAFDHEYIPEHMLTREFLQEVRGLLTDNGVLAANTFSSSRLHDHESATYYSVFGDFYRLLNPMNTGNRIILIRMAGLPGMAEITKNAAALEAGFRPLGASREALLPMLDIERGWPAETKILTDQFSPSNLLNAK